MLCNGVCPLGQTFFVFFLIDDESPFSCLKSSILSPMLIFIDKRYENMKRLMKRLTDKELHRIVKESVDRVVQEAENGGWVVDSSEAEEAYNLAVENMGESTINKAIIRCLSNDALADCLAYIFRMYDFREWANR